MEEAAEVLLEKRLSGAPVVETGGGLVGIITKTDIFRVLVTLTGLKKGGIRLAFKSEDRPDSIKKIIDTVRDYGGRVMSIVSTYDDSGQGYRNVFVRVCDCVGSRLEQMKNDPRIKSAILYSVEDKGQKKDACKDYCMPWKCGGKV